jgi:ribonuclease P protein component
MISYANRFHGRAVLRRLQTRSQSVRGQALALKYAPSTRDSYRLAVVVSRRVSKSAVVRNRIRRRLYECVRHLSGTLQAPYDLVLLVYDERLAELPPAKLQAEVTKLFKKAKLTAVDRPRHGIVEAKE